ncbi:MAG: DNA helicase RecQ [Bernardetiaceae bacterium]|nr:DNA helicase RecQ [Bernardetiaceae bacterium]
MTQSAKEVLHKYFGYDSFRPLQQEAIAQVIAKKDTLLLMPTGGGKSLCYQVPALMLEGLCVVISPLLALMHDQVEALKAGGIAAEYLGSHLSSAEEGQIKQAAQAGQLKILYISPEKAMQTDWFYFFTTLNISLFAIDEAHCVSTWGHHFRPEYAQLHRLRNQFIDIPFLALTATADRTTREDILQQLQLKEPQTLISSFDRPNLSLKVLPAQKRIEVIDKFLEDRKDEAGIIYCRSRNETEQITQKLQRLGYQADYYHAGLDYAQRKLKQKYFTQDKTPIICATVAFGMGIDKPNVRWVIHYNMPKNIESFYQEIGRAGRDGLAAETLLFYSYADVIFYEKLLQEEIQANPQQGEVLKSKLEQLQQYAEASFCRRQILLNYFNESSDKPCGNCDVCENPPNYFDGKILAQKALSAVYRIQRECQSYVNLDMLVDVLRGSKRQDLRDKNFHKIKTYGSGADISRNEWRDYIAQMRQLGIFEIAYQHSHALIPTETGRKVLSGEKQVDLVAVRDVVLRQKNERKKAQRSKREILADKIFDKLKQVRTQIATKQNISPQSIFSDATLQEMAEKIPLRAVDMRRVTGVSDFKLKDFGKPFAVAMITFLQEEGEEFKNLKGKTLLLTWAHFTKSKSLEEVAIQRKLTETTIASHLATLYQMDYPLEVEKLIPKEHRHKLMAYFKSYGLPEDLRTVMEYFNEEIPFPYIRLAQAYFQKQDRTLEE